MTDRGDKPVVVGLLTDPGLAATIARHLADDLADRLAEQVDDRVSWRVEVAPDEPFEVFYDADRIIDKARQRVEGTGWDIAVAITDLPLQTANGVVVAELSRADCVALLSLPALGGIALRRRAREVVVRIVDELTPTMTAGPDGDTTGPTSLRRPRPLRTARPADSDIDDELVIGSGRGELRLLSGMIRANRPWQLAVGLSRALAGAAAGSAFGVLYSTIWILAAALPPWRLAVTTLAAVGIFAVWLVSGHGLWEWSARALPLGRTSNVATLLTVLTGVLVFYVALLGINLVAAAIVIPPDLLAQQLGRAVGWVDYVRVGLMATALGMVAGAVGSGLEDDTVVRSAAYSSREQVRRARAA
ncbi:MAG: hypothetical protein L0H64_13375 [Pseudonocardia sp.]|nr:hypothetical protein [Pseudonocardia sp.]